MHAILQTKLLCMGCSSSGTSMRLAICAPFGAPKVPNRDGICRFFAKPGLRAVFAVQHILSCQQLAKICSISVEGHIRLWIGLICAVYNFNWGSCTLIVASDAFCIATVRFTATIAVLRSNACGRFCVLAASDAFGITFVRSAAMIAVLNIVDGMSSTFIGSTVRMMNSPAHLACRKEGSRTFSKTARQLRIAHTRDVSIIAICV